MNKEKLDITTQVIRFVFGFIFGIFLSFNLSMFMAVEADSFFALMFFISFVTGVLAIALGDSFWYALKDKFWF